MHVHVYVWERIVSLTYRTTSWMFTKFGRDEVFMAPHASLCFSGIPTWQYIGEACLRQFQISSFNPTITDTWIRNLELPYCIA